MLVSDSGPLLVNKPIDTFFGAEGTLTEWTHKMKCVLAVVMVLHHKVTGKGT